MTIISTQYASGIVAATEKAAIASSMLIGLGDEKAADQKGAGYHQCNNKAGANMQKSRPADGGSKGIDSESGQAGVAAECGHG